MGANANFHTPTTASGGQIGSHRSRASPTSWSTGMTPQPLAIRSGLVTDDGPGGPPSRRPGNARYAGSAGNLAAVAADHANLARLARRPGVIVRGRSTGWRLVHNPPTGPSTQPPADIAKLLPPGTPCGGSKPSGEVDGTTHPHTIPETCLPARPPRALLLFTCA